MLYHGSVIGGLETIWARSKSHTSGKQVAYFTSDRVYALVCCRKREENFVTMGPRDGKQHYFERFPDQLKVLYAGREGFLYTPVSQEGLIRTRGNSFESFTDVSVTLYEHVTDVYGEILNEERAGNVIIHRYYEIDPKEQREMALGIRKAWEKGEFDGYRDFVFEHFSPIWE